LEKQAAEVVAAAIGEVVGRCARERPNFWKWEGMDGISKRDEDWKVK
jgi:hypothetical protein